MTVDEFRVADPPDAWAQAGFRVDADGICRVGAVRLSLVGRGHGSGIVGWTLRGLPSGGGDVDGIPTTSSDEVPTVSSDTAAFPPAPHANGVIGIDHVVLMSPDLDRTVTALIACGTRPRRTRDAELGGRPVRQVFFRLGEVILEVVGSPDTTGNGPSTLWGITYAVTDIEQTAAFFDGRTGPVKDAVQPGRRITTLRNLEFGMSVRTAMISAPYPRTP
ncbi:VOC family protein [Mycobacterium sp. 4D054]|uniref:VOC family protein n=1 Tax=unclassified Mycobacterium TaxID=2642494 RepID=UPI0021B3EB75|nr:VOC family protein [Mycobacterium sp. SMC-8]